MTNMMQPMSAMPMPMGGYGMQPVYISSMSQLPAGAIPVSQQMLASVPGMTPGHFGASVMPGNTTEQPEQSSMVSTILKGAGLGAAAGAAFGLIPFLPLGLISGAVVGAGVGAAIALLRGRSEARRDDEIHTMSAEQAEAQARAQAQAQMIASTPPGARSTTAPNEARPSGVVMGPEMRRKWAAKVRAERTAAATVTPPRP